MNVSNFRIMKDKIVEGETKPSWWSDEDEMMCTIAINACEYANDEFESFNDNYEKAIMWLKSLKKRMGE